MFDYSTIYNFSEYLASIIVLIALFSPLTILYIVGIWGIFKKAGVAPWKAIIPFYNLYILTEISGISGFFIALLLFPGVGTIIWSILVGTGISSAFGKKGLFTVGVIVLAPIFYMIIASDDSTYLLARPESTTAQTNPSVQASATEQSHSGQSTNQPDQAYRPNVPLKKPEDPWVTGEE